MSQGSPGIFFTRPIALAFIIACAALFALPAIRSYRRRGAAPEPEDVE